MAVPLRVSGRHPLCPCLRTILIIGSGCVHQHNAQSTARHAAVYSQTREKACARTSSKIVQGNHTHQPELKNSYLGGIISSRLTRRASAFQASPGRKWFYKPTNLTSVTANTSKLPTTHGTTLQPISLPSKWLNFRGITRSWL